jgi:hypothetical protein
LCSTAASTAVGKHSLLAGKRLAHNRIVNVADDKLADTMTSDPPPQMTDEEAIRWVRYIERCRHLADTVHAAKQAQPQRITDARARADTARRRALAEQGFPACWTVAPAVDGNDLAGLRLLTHPGAVELFGNRLALELAANYDGDNITTVLRRIYDQVEQPSHALDITSHALTTLATMIIPQLLAAAEGEPNYSIRAELAEATAAIWEARLPPTEPPPPD